MPLSYTNRHGKTYYLHTGPKRGGGIQHFLSTKKTGSLADSIPEGYEIYETVNGPVHLRKKRVSLVRPEELKLIESKLQKADDRHLYKIELLEDMIVVHEAEKNDERSRMINRFLTRGRAEESAIHFATYTAMLRFILVDQAERIFAPERYCFRGSFDCWISIGPPGRLAKIAPQYLKHLGKESFFELV